MPKIVNKDQKREHLVQAAIPIFAKFGFRETKMSDIAVAADVGKGTLYEYFTSKDELFLHTFTIWFSYFAEQMQEIVSQEKNPYQQLMIFYDQYFQTVEQYADMYFIYFDFWSELTRNPNLNAQDIASTYQSLREMIMSILDDGINKGVFKPMDKAAMSAGLLSLSDGLLMQWLFDPQAFSIRDVGFKSVENFLQALLV